MHRAERMPPHGVATVYIITSPCVLPPTRGGFRRITTKTTTFNTKDTPKYFLNKQSNEYRENYTGVILPCKRR